MQLQEFWWQSDKDDAHHRVFKAVHTLEESQRDTYERFMRYAWLYDSSRLSGVDAILASGPYPVEQGPVTENVIESVIDTAKALIAKNRPRATFVTDGADFSTQRKARQLELFIEAEFHRTQVYDRGVEAFRDGCVYGTGGVKIFSDEDGRVAVERVVVDEIVLDEEACRVAPPLDLHQRKFVDRHLLAADFPEFAELIFEAARLDSRREWTSYRQPAPNQVVVVESWRLPTGRRGTNPGRHTICIGNATLVDEKYTKDHFPFVFYRWSKRLTGFWGRGLAEILAGTQIRLNKHNRVIGTAQDLIAVPRVLVHQGDANIAVKLTNRVGQIIPYRNAEPKFVVPPAIPPELYQDRVYLKQNAYQITGVSELTAQSKKPSGLDSGAALREYNEIETQRFSIQAQEYEAFFLEIARQYVELAKELYGRRKYTAVWKSHNLIKRIPWKDVDLEEDMYQMSIEASSILSRTPAGRLQGAVELVQNGMMDPKVALRLLGHPDLERERDIETASIEDIEATIEELLDGVYRSPEPFQDLALGISRVQMAYLKARRDGAPEEILELMRKWMDNAKAIMDQAQAPQAAMDQAQMNPPPPGAGPIQGGTPQAAMTQIQGMQAPVPVGGPVG